MSALSMVITVVVILLAVVVYCMYRAELKRDHYGDDPGPR
jgi:heme/copper-type cytochrome/quinol oxidase subunit 2